MSNDKPKTPEPIGANKTTNKPAVKTDDKVEVFDAFDDMDVQSILNAQRGLSIGHMIYNLPFATAAGTVNCKFNCKYMKEKRNHTHAIDLGINGVDEFIRHMGGIQISVEYLKVTKLNMKQYYECKAIGRDIFTGVQREATAYFDFQGKKNQKRPQDFPVIARRLAERNVARTLIPQSAREHIVRLAESGQETLTAQNIREILGPIYVEREAKKRMYFQIKAGAGNMEMLPEAAQAPAIDITPDSASIPENTPEPPETGQTGGSSGDFPGTTKQRGAIYGMLKGYGAESDEINGYIDTLSDRSIISKVIGEMKDGDFDRYEAWLKAKFPPAETDTPKQGDMDL